MPSGVYKRPLRLCSIEGCNNKYFCKGLCRKHYYLKYRDNKLKYGKEIGSPRLKERYHLDKKLNLKMNIYQSKRLTKKYKEDKIWREKKQLEFKERFHMRQAISLKNTSIIKSGKWSVDEIKYLEQNHKKKTYLEIALELNRSYASISGAIFFYQIKRKKRILKGVYYKTT